jgi:transposase
MNEKILLQMFGRMLRRHLEGVLRWIVTRHPNAFSEGFIILIQAAKARARGYRTFRSFWTMIYLIAGHMGLLPA